MLRAARIAVALFAAFFGFIYLNEGSLRDWDGSAIASRSLGRIALARRCD